MHPRTKTSKGYETPEETTARANALLQEPITSSTLAPAPQLNIEQPKPDTGVAGMLGTLESTAKTQGDAFTENLKFQRETAQKSEASSFKEYIDAQLGTKGETQLTSEAYQAEGGVDDVQNELQDINQQLLAEQHSLRRRKEAIDISGGGLQSGAESEKRNIERESLRKQADLSIIQMGIQGRYDSAKAIADRQIAVQLERDRTFNKALEDNYNRNKDLFDKTEQREFETMLSDRNRAIENDAEDAKALQSAKIEAIRMARMNGAPASIVSAIQSAETPEAVFDVGGQYASGDMLDRAYKAEQLNALRTKPEALAPTDVIDQGGRKILINTQTGEVIKDFGVSDTPINELKNAVIQQQVSQVDDLKAHKGFNSAVGPVGLGRIALRDVAGAKDSFIGSVEQLTSGLTLEQLIKAKDSGATFGALSDAELRLIEQSATKINKWAMKEDDKTVGYDVSEKDFMTELDTIANFRKLDAVLKGVDPASVGVVQTPDGHYWAKNGDGSVTRIR